MHKIMLVEDNNAIRDMLTRRLVKRGYQVVTAADGGAVCPLALAEQPQLILLDMHLPVMDGWEAAHCLKLAAATRAIPIIALTADAMVGDREKALRAGCDDYETKPVDFTRLVAKIEQFIEPGVQP